jgi:hypothetical protein
MRIIAASAENLKDLAQSSVDDEILFGLERGKLGFIVAMPDIGKGYFALSLAYELCTSKEFVSLSPCAQKRKVLYWPVEDGARRIALRIEKHLETIPDCEKDIANSLSIFEHEDRLNLQERCNVKEDLITACQDYDLLIIDTLREAIGGLDEVENDNEIKQILQTIATKANVAIMIVHHVNKLAAKGVERITNVSGSGLSRTLANARLQIALTNDNKQKTFYSHIKANDVPLELRHLNTPIHWLENSLISINPDLAQIKQKEMVASETKTSKQPVFVEDKQPKSIKITNDQLDPKSFLLAQQASKSRLSEQERRKLEEYKDKGKDRE